MGVWSLAVAAVLVGLQVTKADGNNGSEHPGPPSVAEIRPPDTSPSDDSKKSAPDEKTKDTSFTNKQVAEHETTKQKESVNIKNDHTITPKDFAEKTAAVIPKRPEEKPALTETITIEESSKPTKSGEELKQLPSKITVEETPITSNLEELKQPSSKITVEETPITPNIEELKQPLSKITVEETPITPNKEELKQPPSKVTVEETHIAANKEELKQTVGESSKTTKNEDNFKETPAKLIVEESPKADKKEDLKLTSTKITIEESPKTIKKEESNVMPAKITIEESTKTGSNKENIKPASTKTDLETDCEENEMNIDADYKDQDELTTNNNNEDKEDYFSDTKDKPAKYTVSPGETPTKADDTAKKPTDFKEFSNYIAEELKTFSNDVVVEWEKMKDKVYHTSEAKNVLKYYLDKISIAQAANNTACVKTDLENYPAREKFLQEAVTSCGANLKREDWHELEHRTKEVLNRINEIIQEATGAIDHLSTDGSDYENNKILIENDAQKKLQELDTESLKETFKKLRDKSLKTDEDEYGKCVSDKTQKGLVVDTMTDLMRIKNCVG